MALVLVAQFLARMPMGMYTVAVLLAAVHWTGSYAVAGIAVAGFNLAGGLVAPMVGRLADRHDPRPILAALAIGHAATMTVLVAAGGTVATPTIPVLATVAGACMPPLGPVLRAVWSRRFADDEHVLRAVFGLESVLGEAVYLAGPALAGAVIALSGEGASLLVGAAFVLGGTLAITSGSVLAHKPPAAASRGRATAAALRSRGLQVLVAIQALSFAGFSGVSIGVLAVADDWGSASAGGLLLSLWAAGAVLGALIWGARAHWPGTQVHQMHAVLWLVAIGAGLTAAAALVPGGAAGWTALGAALLLSGVVLSPAAILESTLIGRITAEQRRTESYAWMGTAAMVGSAAGSALYGVLVEQWDGTAALAAAVIAAVGCALLGRAGRTALAG